MLKFLVVAGNLARYVDRRRRCRLASRAAGLPAGAGWQGADRQVPRWASTRLARAPAPIVTKG